ncbi:MAG TPA: DNA-3-methyladenine glycosylase 2 family protein [Candidatus Eisenbacteria bacterium]|nr:DNA-3-methyladenine glycosylase 2 family protein [Candidatus Eisenbacteria bacterium]
MATADLAGRLDLEIATAAIAAADPAMSAFVARAGPLESRPGQGDHFRSLARAIVFQQLAGKAAAAIHGRVEAALGGQISPAGILATAPETLRAAGLSANKAASLVDLATKSLDGAVPLAGIEAFDDEEIILRLTTVRGIGRWTAEMFLLFELQRPDVWPVDDLGVRNGWTLIHGLPEMIKPKELQAAGERFRPHRSAVALYCWHAVHMARGEVPGS